MVKFIILRTSAIILSFTSTYSFAACTDQNNNVVRCPDEDDRLLGVRDSGGGQGGGGGLMGGGGTSISPETQDKIINAIKASKTYCKKSSEDCGAWGSRMTAPMPIGSGFCPNISTILPVIGQALCNQAVTFGVNLNGCANVGCP